MSWLKLLRHDIRSGLLRWRYLCVPLMFCLPCFYCWIHIHNAGLTGTWMDYLLFCFKGIPPLLSMEDFEFPIQWFLIMGGCLFLNLDYPLNDLTEAGQQVIIRSVNKTGWYLSKCAWNLLSCSVYLLLGAMTALVFALTSGGTAVLVNTPEVTAKALQIYGVGVLSVGQALLAAVVLPCLTLAAFNMLQMALCLMTKPVFAFLICICLLILSLFVNTPFIPGNGAMVTRNGILAQELFDPVVLVSICLGVVVVSLAVGILRFNRMDHLRYEG